MEYERNALLSLAWHTAALYRQEKLMPLRELIGGPKEQSIEDMRNIAIMYTQMLGGTVVRRGAS
jgi:hypothetical protein